ncbi:MOSC domain-containing protein [Marinovum algicola]|uniref:MOSC domain-containing protein n=1 Tax=Marinovum algicola TaxID=42444 RepID=UPI003218087A
MAELIARYARPGRVEWIGVRPERRGAMRALETVEVTEAGLAGDHGRAGKRAVTLVQAEHLAVIGAFLGRDAAPAEALRRNLVVSGINLAGLRGGRWRWAGRCSNSPVPVRHAAGWRRPSAPAVMRRCADMAA